MARILLLFATHGGFPRRRFEFPEEIDMYKYTVTGLEEREAREAAASGEAEEEGGTPTSAKNPEECKYFLKGIVVHSGTAFAGHYYSYIKARPCSCICMAHDCQQMRRGSGRAKHAASTERRRGTGWGNPPRSTAWRA